MLNLIFSPKVTHTFNKDAFDILGHQPKKASNKVQLSRIGSRLRAFQRAIDEVCTLPLTPPKGDSKNECVV